MKILLLGKDGQLGWELQRALAPVGDLVALGQKQADLSDRAGLRRIVRDVAPAAIVNAAAYTAVDKAESESALAQCINADAVGELADEARRLGAWLIHYSTDYVFDGKKATPYTEADATSPLSVYGSTKLQGEIAIRERHDQHLIFRTSWVYAARGNNFAKTMLRLAKELDELTIVGDQHGAPTSAELLADVTALALYRITVDGLAPPTVAGTYHVAAGGETTWYDYAQYVFALARERSAKLKTAQHRVKRISTEAYPLPAARPKNSRLDTAKLRSTFNLHLPDWRYHVARLVEELRLQGVL